MPSAMLFLLDSVTIRDSSGSGESDRSNTVDEHMIVLAVLPAERADLVSQRNDNRSRRRMALYALTGLIGLCLTGFFGFHLYLQIAEWRDASAVCMLTPAERACSWSRRKKL